ncbi:uncharacterized protein LOC134441547 [Engraulis encrasicolus]|uniref:uncharacterized protein LOC134441547 n=1 Tax=Engraulis encrasicolus TaxID=184585 RepID=UPI002FD363E9
MHLSYSSMSILLLLSALMLLPDRGVYGTYVPARCQCPKLMLRTPRRPVDFIVSPRNAHCHTPEIMVKLPGYEDKLLCLSPAGVQGKRLLRCWRRVKREGKDHLRCLRIRKKNRRGQKNRRTHTQ